MERINYLVNQAKEQNRPLYIRGTTAAGIYLGIYLDWRGVKFEGYIDSKPHKWGKIVYGEHMCYSPEQMSIDGFVFIVARAKHVQSEIASELKQKGVFYADNIYDDILKCIEHIDDEFFLKCFFEAKLGYKLNLENPRTLCEKLQWIKLYDRNPLYTKMVDKYEVKNYVSEIIGSKYVLPALGVWNNFEEIDFEKLPNSFVLKWTDDSGSIVIVNDKNNLDKADIQRKMEKEFIINYFYLSREWPYKNVKPRIIAEKYIDSLGKPESIEYKVTCFNGKVGFVTICQGIAHSSFDVRTNDSYDVNFNHMPWYAYYKNSTGEIQKPEQWDELITICEKLAANIPYVRIDWYIVDGQIYFGEMTFFTWGGFIEFTPPEWDLKLGECLKLPER